ncbi:MAG: NADPH-dependent 7-cyano-7-deazaguanine reductase QueF-like protein [Psychrobacter okhotskensis]|jgi:NADPH-dependent 7-cyano-7-deazaguanine reductase QueF-like protein
MIDPFANDHQSMQIGELTIENQTDKIIIYGDIDLYLNEIGFEQAKQLNELTSKIIQHFEKTSQYTINDEVSKIKDDRTDGTVDNPFL